MAARSDPNSKLVAENRRARREYEIEDVIEAGLILTGPEVKSLRLGTANIAESYAQAKNGEVSLINAYIPEYAKANHFAHETRRPRRLLLHLKEIAKLTQGVQREGMTLVPLKLYFNDRGIAKLTIGLAKGRKLHDKRAHDKERDWKREQGRILRDRG